MSTTRSPWRVPPLRDHARGRVLPTLTDDALADPNSAYRNLRERLLRIVPEQRQNVLACVVAMTKTFRPAPGSLTGGQMAVTTGVPDDFAWQAVLTTYPHVLREQAEA